MKRIPLVLFIIFSFSILHLHAQVENVIVEKYYISDANDAGDTVGGNLQINSKTYRVFIDLAAGSRITKIYGDQHHPLIIKSTEIFFNNLDRGQSFGKDFNKSHYGDNTVALDTWLTLGQVTKTGAKTYFGILKSEDSDGSFVGGVNNDEGLLINNNSEAGIPLTAADGIDTMAATPDNWSDYGIIDSNGDDTTIFGSLKAGVQFISYDAVLQNSGVTGVNPDSNLVLVAQLTTKGDISFELNIEVLDTSGNTIRYVASDSILLTGETLCRNLKYPFEQVCGCPDPDYVEYIADRDCDEQDSCKSLIVFGCMDTVACNYDPDANFHLHSLCCYPGFCNDRDISLICPELNYGKNGLMGFNLFPNPAQDKVTLQVPAHGDSERQCIIYNCMGKIIRKEIIGMTSYPVIMDIDITELQAGIYIFRVEYGTSSDQTIFIKY